MIPTTSRTPLQLLIAGIALLLLSSCSKDLTHTFDIYYYSANKATPAIYLFNGNKQLGKVPYLTPEQQKPANMLHYVALSNSLDLDIAQANGTVVGTISYSLNDDGTFNSGGGGYLDYDISSHEKYNIVVGIKGQF